MEEINRILVVLDPHLDPTPKAQPAIAKGLELAKASGAELHLTLTQYDQHIAGSRMGSPQDAEAAREQFVDTWQGWLDGIAESLDHTGCKLVETDLHWDHPWHDGVIRQVMRLGPDLVIKDVHHHPRWGRAVFTNTDWHLVRECPAPLMMLKHGRWHRPARVLAAVDPLHERDKPAALDRRIMNSALAVSGAVEGDLHVFHSYLPAMNLIPVEAGGIPMNLPYEQNLDRVTSSHREALDKLLQPYEIDSENVHLEPGQPADALLARIDEERVDLVVMGAVARGALKRLFLGSTAERVFGELTCDVLIVKDESFVCPVDPA
jgi:universal stress protein E